jgi:putative metal-binding protein
MIVWGGDSAAGVVHSGGKLRVDVLPDQDADQDGSTACGGDCDDFNAAVHSGATEVCNFTDDNCSGGIDEPFDLDADGATTCGGDCNDGNPGISPFTTETCNGIDDNCTAGRDEGFPDADHDGWAACVDCNDSNSSQNPGFAERCDGLDNNCDSSVDEGGDALCGTGLACGRDVCMGSLFCRPSFYPAGTPCTDNNACTQTDACNGSVYYCVGSNPVVCTAPDDCHNAGTCSPSTGQCSAPIMKPNGTACNDGDGCTIAEFCAGGSCGGGSPKDSDADAHIDAACGGNDCNDANAMVWSLPWEVTNLTLSSASPADSAWDSQASAGPETVYDLLSGTLTATGSLDTGSASCLASQAVDTTFTDARPDPDPGTGLWYLARARNSCGIGTYGAGTDGVPRSIPACP